MPRGERDDFYQPNKDRLEQLAYRAIQQGKSTKDFVVLCIDVDDLTWRELADGLMPSGANAQQFRDLGQTPVLRGIVPASFIDCLSDILPDLKPALRSVLPVGYARAIVLSDGGASVYIIQPNPQSKLN